MTRATVGACTSVRPGGRNCREPAGIIDLVGGLLCASCYEEEIRRRGLLMRVEKRGLPDELKIGFADVEFLAKRTRNGVLLKAYRITAESPNVHGIILIDGTKVETHFTNEDVDRNSVERRRNITGPGVDFAPLLGDVYAERFVAAMRRRLNAIARPMRSVEELRATGAAFVTWLPIGLELTSEMVPFPPYDPVVPFALPPGAGWAAWKAPAEPAGLVFTIDEGMALYFDWRATRAVALRVLRVLEEKHRPSFASFEPD